MLHNPIFIDNEGNQAIRREIGERLRLELGIELELPAGLKGKLDELRWLEGQSFSNRSRSGTGVLDPEVAQRTAPPTAILI